MERICDKCYFNFSFRDPDAGHGFWFCTAEALGEKGFAGASCILEGDLTMAMTCCRQ